MHRWQYIGIGVTVLVVSALAGYMTVKYFDQSSATLPSSESIAEQPPDEVKNQLQCIESLPNTVKVNQKIMVAVYRDHMAELIPVVSAAGVGGIIVMDEVAKEQLTSLREAFTVPPIIAVDQEGGTVQRYKEAGPLAGAEEVASTLHANEAYEIYFQDSRRLYDKGITTNFAPVVDVDSRSPSPLPGRIYSSNPDIVVEYASAFIAAARDAGVQPVLKHFPGIGSASGNTDFGRAETDPLPVLDGRDLLPYRKLASKAPDVMVSNAVVPGLTQDQPTIWSQDAVALLRSLGYEDAVVYSDSLTAEAIPDGADEAAVKSWRAGIDIVVIVQSFDDTANMESYIAGITRRAQEAINDSELETGELNQSIYRIFHRKQIDACQPLD